MTHQHNSYVNEPGAVTSAYVADIERTAVNVEAMSPVGSDPWDLAQYARTLVAEVWRLREAIARLEGWKEAVEPVIDRASRPGTITTDPGNGSRREE